MVRKGEELNKGFCLVDKILSHRRGISEIEYKVKWLGLTELDCTWQPESTMCVQESCEWMMRTLNYFSCGETPDTTCAEEEIDAYYSRRLPSERPEYAKQARNRSYVAV